MTARTSVAPYYTVKNVGLIIACIAFGIWGAYDLLVKLPGEQALAERFVELTRESEAIEAELRGGQASVPRERAERYEAVQRELGELAPGGETPAPPEAFDRLVCWFFIACILCAPWFLLQYLATRRRVYTLDEDGTFSAPEGSWPADRIQDVDMGRWMSRSIAWVVIDDGTRIKLDDYIHRGTAVIVGRLAARFHPEEWTDEARPVGSDAEDAEDDVDDVDAKAEERVG